MRHFIVASEAALVAVSIVILAFPEARTPPMSFLLNFLWVIVGGAWFIQMRKAGVLQMTPKETYRTAGERPKASLLTFVALMLSFYATVVQAFH
jgi:hypothetical protein